MPNEHEHGEHCHHHAPPSPLIEKLRTYYPLILVGSYLLGATAIAAWSQWMDPMVFFMGAFFVTFSFFKFLDLKGFADAFRGYDLVAKVFPFYGTAYPFIELGLGVLYLTGVFPFWTGVATLVVMAVSSLGVLRALLRKDEIRCACLGTVINLPMTSITLLEDLLMGGMALLMLISGV